MCDVRFVCVVRFFRGKNTRCVRRISEIKEIKEIKEWEGISR